MDSEAALECGHCRICGQKRVLGFCRPSPQGSHDFWCCACFDRFGDEEDGNLSQKQIDDRTIVTDDVTVSNREPPARLADVPPGQLRSVSSWVQGPNGKAQMMTSILDPEHNYFMGLGGERVWPAAGRLASFLVYHLGAHGRKGAPPMVVELGAGTGYCGMALAKHGAEVVLTDVPWLLPLLQYNVEANFGASKCSISAPKLASLRWGSVLDAAELLLGLGGRAPDLVIGSDVVYQEALYEPLLSTVLALGAVDVILGIIERDDVTNTFRARLQVLGWGWRLLHREATADSEFFIIRLMVPQSCRGKRWPRRQAMHAAGA